MSEPFKPKIVNELPQAKRRGRPGTDYAETIAFVEEAAGAWVQVAEKDKVGTAYAIATKFRKEAGDEFEVVVRGIQVFMRLIVDDDDSSLEPKDNSNDQTGVQGQNPNF